MRTIKLGFWALFFIFALAISVALIGQNTEPVAFTIFNYISQPYPKWGVLLGCVFIGAAIATMFFVVELIVLETRNIRLRRLNQKLERAVAAATGSPMPIDHDAEDTMVSPSLPKITPAFDKDDV